MTTPILPVRVNLLGKIDTNRTCTIESVDKNSTGKNESIGTEHVQFNQLLRHGSRFFVSLVVRIWSPLLLDTDTNSCALFLTEY